MSWWSISGSWIGEYAYDVLDIAKAPPPPVTFTLQARQGWFGLFRGTVQDDPTKSAPDPATIRGRVSGWMVSFQKCYSQLYMISGDRLVTLAEYVASRFNLQLQGNPAPTRIHYRGEYDEREDAVTGTWRIDRHRFRFRAGGKTVTMTKAGGSGRWTMRREATY